MEAVLPGYGTLYVVATPLGNLEDLTFRALRVLKSSGLAAAEDTRRTAKLLNHYGIKTKLVSYREENHARVLPRLIKFLKSGEDLALVSDAGTPGLSDPGEFLIRAAGDENITVAPVPGPSAVAGALSVSGLPGSGFVFAGFLPAKKNARLKIFEELHQERRTIVFFETPHRIVEAFKDAATVFGSRQAVLCREMTKVNEEFIRGSVSEIHDELAMRPGSIKGEITVVMAGAAETEITKLDRNELKDLIRGDNRPVKEIVAELSGLSTMSRSELYRLILDVKED